jgi:pilus assembly protein CpaC
MHRPIRMVRLLIPGLILVISAYLGAGASRALAQDKVTVVGVPINGSQILEMSKQQRIKDVDNKDQNVARVNLIPGDTRRVMIVAGGGAGITRLVLTDFDGAKETFDIVVEFNTEYLRRVLSQVVPSANVKLVQGTGNTLIVSGTVSKAEDIEVIMKTAEGAVGKNVVNNLIMAGPPMVQLDLVIASVSRSEARSFGFSFYENSPAQFFTNTLNTGSLATTLTNTVGNTITSLTTTPNIVGGLISTNNSFIGYINALRTEDLVKVMAEPKFVCISGKSGQFISGGEQAVPQLASGSAGGGAVSGVTFIPFGTTVNYLPIVLGYGKVYLEIEAEYTFPNPSQLFGTTLPGSTTQVSGRDTQKVKTSVVVEDGQTLAIGGMLFHNINGSTSKVPVLGDIPYLGMLFSQVNYTDAELELVILVTPHMVDSMACNQLPKHLPGEESRRPDDYELFLERILEAPRGQRDVFHGCEYVPAYKNSGPTADLYPCPGCNGPRGACDIGRHAGPGCNADSGACNNGCGSCAVKATVGQPVTGGNAAPATRPEPAQSLQSLKELPQAPSPVPETRTEAAPATETVPATTLPASPAVPTTNNPAVLVSPRALECPQGSSLTFGSN